MVRSAADPGLRPIRVAALVVIAFILTDAAMLFWAAHRFASDSFRLPADSDALLTEYLDALGKRPGPILYFVGDSTMQGQRLPADRTVPAKTAVKLRRMSADYTVANLGLTASKIPDFFYLTARLRTGRGDVAVYNVNYKNFGEYDLALPLRFKELYDPSLDRLAGKDARELLGVPEPDSAKTLGEKTNGFFKAHWFLYRNRDLVNAALFGLHPRKLLKGYYQEAASIGFSASLGRAFHRRAPGASNWTSSQWDARDVSILKRYYDADTLDEDNPVFRFLRPTARLAAEKRIDAFFFANPMNLAICDRFGLVNWPLYQSNFERVRRAVEAGGGRFFDYTDLIPSSEFIDNDHLTSEGAERLAVRLAEDILSALRVGDGKAAP